MKKNDKELVLNYFAKQYSSNLRHFYYLFSLTEFEARDKMKDGWEKRLLGNLELIRKRNRELYNSIRSVALKEYLKPDTANYTSEQDHLTENLIMIQSLKYQQTLRSFLEQMVEVQAIGDIFDVMLDLSLHLRETIEEIKNPLLLSRKTIESEIKYDEFKIAEKYRLLRKIKSRSEAENTKTKIVTFTKRISNQ